MSDNYQAIFDAVRSRLSNCDFYFENACNRIQDAASNYDTPSAIYKPKLYPDGNMWCALYGDNLQDGVAGFGDSPAKAMANFDVNWNKSLSYNK